jgi:hypothetical protein
VALSISLLLSSEAEPLAEWRSRGFPATNAEALIKLEAREARLRGLDMPTKVAVTDPDGGIPLETIRRAHRNIKTAGP